MSVGFDWTVKFGDILVILGFLGTGGTILFRRGGDLKELKMAISAALGEIAELKTEVKQMGKVLTELAVQRAELSAQKDQINLVMKWYDELRRGTGWVTGSKGVDREYK